MDYIYITVSESMTPQLFSFEIKEGDSWQKTLVFKDEDDNLIDVSAWKVYFMVKEKLTDLDASAKISKTITTFTGLGLGEVLIELTSVETSITVGTYIFGCKVITDNLIGATKEALTVLEGDVSITDRIVQATT
jgi:hypothetical protein